MPGPGFRLLAITPPEGTVDPDLSRIWATAASVGIALLLREPGSRPSTLLDHRHRFAPLRRACADRGLPCLISIDPVGISELSSIAMLHEIAGVQLRGDPDSLTLAAAREQLRTHQILGRSCHGTPRPQSEAANYSVFAPVFPPRTASPEPGPGKRAVGLAPLRALAAREPHVFALGGITPHRASLCLRAGAFGIASIRSFFGPLPEVADNVARLVHALAEPHDDAAYPR